MPARYAILGLLTQQPMHGYDIDGQFDKGLRRVCHVNISQIYAYLKTMEERGWVESETIYQKSNPPKRVFHVTDKGREEMAAWLREPVVADRQIRDELLTKIYFSWLHNPEGLLDLIDGQIAILEKSMADLAARHAGSSNFLGQILSEAGRRHGQADREWLDWLRQQVEERLAQGSEANRSMRLPSGSTTTA